MCDGNLWHSSNSVEIGNRPTFGCYENSWKFGRKSVKWFRIERKTRNSNSHWTLFGYGGQFDNCLLKSRKILRLIWLIPQLNWLLDYGLGFISGGFFFLNRLDFYLINSTHIKSWVSLISLVAISIWRSMKI